MPENQNQKEEDIVIRTMKSDLEDLDHPRPKKGKTPIPAMPAGPISKETQYNISQAPITPMPPKTETKIGPPVLIVPPKIIPPKKTPEILIRPIYKTMPTWIKLGAIGLGVIFIVLLGLYGYWKIFIQAKPSIAPITVPPATTTVPDFPITPTATTTAPIKFFNKLPNKIVTIDLPSKVSAALIQALKSEAAVSETLASTKQIKITYRGKSITVQEFFDLMSIFAPRDFMSNYETEFALAYFSQKEGARPILILKTKNRELARTQIDNWEKATLSSDIFPLFLTNFKIPATLPAFKSYLFINQPVRYLNVSVPFASLNYASYNDFLIFTTSSAGMFIILQDLTGQNVSFEYLKSLEASISNFVK